MARGDRAIPINEVERLGAALATVGEVQRELVSGIADFAQTRAGLMRWTHLNCAVSP